MKSVRRRQVLGATGIAIGGGLAGAATGTAAAHATDTPLYTTADLSVRDGPGTDYERIAVAEQYTGGRVVDGPVDSDGYTWWEIAYNGDDDNGRVTGWSVEQYTAHADFAYPCDGVVSQEHKTGHAALDIANDKYTDIYAARDGVVDVTAYEADGCGYYIKVDHGDGYRTMYCHLNEILVSEGESVARGDHIGEMGDTGRSTGDHLHFTVERDGVHQYVPGDYGDEIDALTGLAKDYDGIGSV